MDNVPYIIGFKKTALEQIRKLDRVVIERLLEQLLRLSRSVQVVPHEALTGQWRGLYRIRVGDYRVIYTLEHDERLIVVEAVGHRRDIYQD